LKRDDALEASVAEKQAHDDAQVAELVKEGVKPIRLVYADGGQNNQFRGQPSITDVSDPDALMTGPTEVVLDEHGKPVPAVVKVAEADAARATAATTKPLPAATASPAAKAPVVGAAAPQQPAPAAPSSETASGGSVFSGVLSGGSVVKKWFSFGSNDSAASAVKVYEPAEPVPTDVPLPPRRNVNAAASVGPAVVKPQASLTPARVSPLVTVAAAMQTNGKLAQ
jgi:hypothetical protein